jgi:hypothetical protein
MHFFSILTKHYIACCSVYIIKAFLVKPKVSHAVALNFIFFKGILLVHLHLTCMLKKD